MNTRTLAALFVFVVAPFLAHPAEADSDGYYCVGPRYLAYQFGFAAPSAKPHHLNVVRLGGPAIVAEPIAFALPQFQVHGMACDAQSIRVWSFDGLYTVTLDAEGRPTHFWLEPLSKPGAFPPEMPRQQNLATGSRSVNSLKPERVSLLRTDSYEVVLDVSPRSAAERCVTLIRTRVVGMDLSGKMLLERVIFEGEGHRECGGAH